MYEAKKHDREFAHHDPKGDQNSRYNVLREKANEYATLIEMCCRCR